MKKKFTISLAICAISINLLNSGCASIFGHSSYNVTINSNPQQADLSVVDKKGIEIYKGKTPATIKLKSSAGYFSKAQYQLKYHLAGYQDKIVTLDSKLNGWYFGNILLGGLIGMLIIDPATGAMYKINDTAVTEELKANTQSQLEVIDINTLTKDQLKKIVKLN